MRKEIGKVLVAMREDYKRWSNRCARHDSYAGYSDVKKEMEREYGDGLGVIEGDVTLQLRSTNLCHTSDHTLPLTQNV